MTTAFYETIEHRSSSAVQELEELERASLETNPSAKSKEELAKALSQALSQASDGEGAQMMAEKMEETPEKNDEIPFEQKSSTPDQETQNELPGDLGYQEPSEDDKMIVDLEDNVELKESAQEDQEIQNESQKEQAYSEVQNEMLEDFDQNEIQNEHPNEYPLQESQNDNLNESECRETQDVYSENVEPQENQKDLEYPIQQSTENECLENLDLQCTENQISEDFGHEPTDDDQMIVDTEENVSLEAPVPDFHEEAVAVQQEFEKNCHQGTENMDDVITIRMSVKRKAGVLEEDSILTELGKMFPEDPDRMFLLSLMPAMKRVRMDKVDDVRRKIIKVLHKNKCRSAFRNYATDPVSIGCVTSSADHRPTFSDNADTMDGNQGETSDVLESV